MGWLLSVHIGGGLITLVLATGAGWTLLTKPTASKKLAMALAGIGVFQLVSGVLLVSLTPGISLPRACVMGLLYLAVVGSLEVGLIKKLARAGQPNI